MNTAVKETLGEVPLGWSPITADQVPTLSGSWKHVDLPPILLDRAARFWGVVIQERATGVLAEPFEALGRSHLSTDTPVSVHATQVHGTFDGGAWTEACEALRQEFPHISRILWDTIASLGNREDPLSETSIINVQDQLPYSWGVCDAALHALGKSYGLFHHVQETLRKHTGYVLVHGCGCDHVVAEFPAHEGSFPTLPADLARRLRVSREWLDHFLGELYLIHVVGLPFRMNPEDFDSKKIVSIGS